MCFLFLISFQNNFVYQYYPFQIIIMIFLKMNHHLNLRVSKINNNKKNQCCTTKIYICRTCEASRRKQPPSKFGINVANVGRQKILIFY
jgi:hypothetical protein